ncbi:MAG: hypothetical protein WCI18_08525, partial [Pseudomonadota bacterium]
ARLRGSTKSLENASASTAWSCMKINRDCSLLGTEPQRGLMQRVLGFLPTNSSDLPATGDSQPAVSFGDLKSRAEVIGNERNLLGYESS